jgi:hypothetical protein
MSVTVTLGVSSTETGRDRGQRDDAGGVYEETIRQTSVSGGLEGHHVAGIWQDAWDYWQSLPRAEAHIGITSIW